MNKILSLVVVAVMCCCVMSCNEKPKSYRFVQVNKDGSEKVEDLKAKNDTDALNLYFERMEKIIIANVGKEDSPIQSMYVISPEGDTLNTNAELLQAVMKDVPVLVDDPAPAAEEAPAAEPQPAPGKGE